MILYCKYIKILHGISALSTNGLFTIQDVTPFFPNLEIERAIRRLDPYSYFMVSSTSVSYLVPSLSFCVINRLDVYFIHFLVLMKKGEDV
jgi:hypothetical protein